MFNLIIEKLNHSRALEVPIEAKLIILGLTPGRVQHEAINQLSNPREGSFKGSMRIRLHKWFEELGINSALGIEHKDDVFIKKKYEKVVFMTSLLRDPVYYSNGKNYSGRAPYPWVN